MSGIYSVAVRAELRAETSAVEGEGGGGRDGPCLDVGNIGYKL